MKELGGRGGRIMNELVNKLGVVDEGGRDQLFLREGAEPRL